MSFAGIAVYDSEGQQILGTPTRTFKRLGQFQTSCKLAKEKYGECSVYQDYTDNNIVGKNLCYYISDISWKDNIVGSRLYNSYPAFIRIVNGNTFRIVYGSDKVVGSDINLSYYEFTITYGYI